MDLKMPVSNISENESLTVKEANSSIDKEWIEFIQNYDECSIYYHPVWLRVLQGETNQKVIKLVCRDNSGHMVGILPLQFTKGVPFGLGGIAGAKRISSLPRTPVSGLIASNEDIADLLISKANEISKNKSNHRLQIKSFNDNLNSNIKDLSKHFWREVYFTDIPKYPEEIRFGNSKNHSTIKRAVNKAIKSGVTIKYSDSEIDLLAWYKLYLDTMKFHTSPPRSLGFFKSLWNNLKSKGLMQLALAELEDGGGKRIIAGSIFLNFNKTVVYAFNGSNRKDFELRPNDLIHWTIIHDAQKNGFEVYDLGEVANGQDGLAAYKQKWASRILKMYHYYCPDLNEKNEENIDSDISGMLLKNVWNILPLKITSIIGSQISKYL